MNSSEMNSTKHNETGDPNSTDVDSAPPGLNWVPYPRPFMVIMGLLHVLVLLVSLTGNSIILSVKLFSKRGRATRKSSFLLLNLVISDLLTSLFCIFPATVQVMLEGYWIFGEFFCSIYGLLLYTGVTCSYVFMTLLAMERYFVIRRPAAHAPEGHGCINSGDLWKNVVFLRTAAIVAWIFCFSTNIVFYFTYAVSIPQTVHMFGKSFDAELCQNHWRTNYAIMQPIVEAMLQSHVWYQLFVYYLIPLCVIGTTYSLIIRKLRKAKRDKALRQDTIRCDNGGQTSAAANDTPKTGCPSSKTSTSAAASFYVSKNSSGAPNGSKSDPHSSLFNRSQSANPNNSSSNKRFTNKSMVMRDRDRSNTVRMLISVTLCFAICSLPRHLLNFVGYFRVWVPLENTQICVVIFILFLNSALNPLIIIIFSRSIRVEIREFLFCCKVGRARTDRNFIAMQSQHYSSRQAVQQTKLMETRS